MKRIKSNERGVGSPPLGPPPSPPKAEYREEDTIVKIIPEETKTLFTIKIYDLETFVNTFEEDFSEDFGSSINWRQIAFSLATWLDEKGIAKIETNKTNLKEIYSRKYISEQR